ncbi:MAG: cupin domain-containing protein [Gaiellaceae bacterium]
MTSRMWHRRTGSAAAGRRTWPAQPSEQQTGIAYIKLRPGKRSPFSHRHTNAEEIYVILSGTGAVKLGNEVVDVRPLDAIRVAPEIARAFEAGRKTSRSSPWDHTNPRRGTGRRPVDSVTNDEPANVTVRSTPPATVRRHSRALAPPARPRPRSMTSGS